VDEAHALERDAVGHFDELADGVRVADEQLHAVVDPHANADELRQRVVNVERVLDRVLVADDDAQLRREREQQRDRFGHVVGDAQRVLLVDGERKPGLRAAGACDATPRRVDFDLSPFAGRTALVRAVDAADGGPWGWLAVDDIRLSWADRGVETPRAGEAFVLSRDGSNSSSSCS
jgi:hypothetical protein